MQPLVGTFPGLYTLKCVCCRTPAAEGSDANAFWVYLEPRERVCRWLQCRVVLFLLNEI